MSSYFEQAFTVEPPQRVRDQPMQVLALGLPRTGTDALRTALETLGYDKVYYGLDTMASAPDCVAWSRLHGRRARGESISAADFDAILGDRVAVIDQPCCLYGVELIDAYPQAKVILSYDTDVDIWYDRAMGVVESVESWPRRMRAVVEADEYWTLRNIRDGWVRYFRGNYRKNGKQMYKEHYARLKEKLGPGGYLEWKREDGWAPLCKFLQRPVPKEPFPEGKPSRNDMVKAGKVMMERADKGNARLILVAASVGTILCAIGYQRLLLIN